MKAIDTAWVTIHGPPRELITDGESGIVVSQRTHEFLARKGIKLHPRGKDQHARYIERRGALLRDTIHRVEGQMKEEGLAGVPFESILAECVFWKCDAYSRRKHPLQCSLWMGAYHPPEHRPHYDTRRGRQSEPGHAGAHTPTSRSQRSGNGGRLSQSQAWASLQHEDDHASTEAKSPGRRRSGLLSRSRTEEYSRLVGSGQSRRRVACHSRSGHPPMA